MDEAQTYTLDKAHQYFAQSINGRVWELLQKPDRTQIEDDEMLYAVHACAFHWKTVGTAAHQQRGEWLIARVHVALNHSQEALRHAKRCFQLTIAHKEWMADFDIAYAYEGMARALALSGDRRKAEEYVHLARKAGEEITDEEDKSIFWGDFQGGIWSGIAI
jgi:hypothetical protein